MGIGTYGYHIYVIDPDIIEKHAPEELAEFNRLVAKHFIDLGRFISSLDQGDESMAIDAMDIEFTDVDGKPLPFLADMSEEEYQQAVFEEVVAAHNAVVDKFKEETGVNITMWAVMMADCGSSEELDLDEAYWIMEDPVEFKPEVKALGYNSLWQSFRDYVITC